MSKRKPAAAKAPGHAPTAPGADNNTRLAFLEEGARSLAVRVAALNGVPVGEIVEPFAAAQGALDVTIERASSFEKSNADLMTNVSLLAVALSGAGVEIPEGMDPILTAIAFIEGKEEDANHGQATAGELAAIARAELAEADAVEARGDLEEALVDNNRLKNELQALKEGRDPEAAEEPEGEEEPAAPPPPRERPEAARDVGPTFGQGSAVDIATLLADGTAELELAFSNGVHELVAFGPQAIDAGALVYRGRQFHVEPSLFVKGAGYTEELHGVGLIANGEQVAYCEFPEPQTVEPGQERKLERMIVFG